MVYHHPIITAWISSNRILYFKYVILLISIHETSGHDTLEEKKYDCANPKETWGTLIMEKLKRCHQFKNGTSVSKFFI